MKTVPFLVGVLLLVSTLAATRAGAAPRPGVDPHKIVNASIHLLREKEPEMTEAEYAIYQRIVPMVRAQPTFALKMLEDMMASGRPSSASFDLVLGNLYYEQGRHADAEARFRQALRKHPAFLRAWDNLGVLEYATGRFAEAAECFARVVAHGGREARVFGLMGYCLAQSGNPVAAEMAYAQACTIEPANPDWTEGLLNIFVTTRQQLRAEALVRQLIRLRPQEGRHWLLLANLLAAQSRELDATATLETAASLGVLPADGLPLLGDLYVGLTFYADALRIYGKLASTDQTAGAERISRLARALTASGDLAAAGLALDQLEQVSAADIPAAVQQARAEWLLARGERPRARELFELVLAREPLNGRALLDLASIHGGAGDDPRAEFALESALVIPEVAPTAALRLAQLKVRRHRYTEALALLDKALAADGSLPLREYRERVRALGDDGV